MGANATALLFVLDIFLAMDVDPYLASRLESNKPVDMIKGFATLEKHFELEAPAVDKTKLLYHIHKLTAMHCLCIPPFIAPDVLAIAYVEAYPGFT